MTRREIVLRNKLLKGMHLSYNRLIEEKSKENGALFFSSEEGKIVKVQARSIKKTDTVVIPTVK